MSEYLGCGNHSCRIEKPAGMGTNAGCFCLDGLPFEQRSKIIRAFDRERKRADKAEAKCLVLAKMLATIAKHSRDEANPACGHQYWIEWAEQEAARLDKDNPQ